MSDTTTNPNKWAVLSTVLVGVFMAMIDSSIVNVALPTLVRELHADFVAIQWVPLGYMLTVTCLMMLAGRLADIWGKRNIYALGFATFTVASLLCGLAGSLSTLVAARVLQGVGAAIIMAIGPAVLVATFPPQERGKAIGLTGSVVSLGIVLGPTVGGFLLAHAHWGWIFAVNVPFGLVGTVLVMRLVSSARPPTREPFDLPGALTLSTGLLALLLALTVGQKGLFSPGAVTALWAVGFGALLAFVLIEVKTPKPMMDLRIFQNLTFSVNLAASFLNFIALAGVVILTPFYLQGVLKLSPQATGLTLAAMPLVIGVVAPLAGSLSDRYGTPAMTSLGLLVLGLGFLLVKSLGTETSVVGYVARFAVVGLGIGLFQSPNNSAILGAAPRASLGVASGLLAVARTLGQTSGIAVLSTFWASRVLTHAQWAPGADASKAPLEAQVAALSDTSLVLVALTAGSLLLVATAFFRSRQVEAPAVASAKA